MRWLSPNVGRWLTQDIYRGVAAVPSTLKRYDYVSNNPGRYVDFWGLKWGDTTYDPQDPFKEGPMGGTISEETGKQIVENAREFLGAPYKMTGKTA